jgi:hypothetical protein
VESKRVKAHSSRSERGRHGRKANCKGVLARGVRGGVVRSRAPQWGGVMPHHTAFKDPSILCSPLLPLSLSSAHTKATLYRAKRRGGNGNVW